MSMKLRHNFIDDSTCEFCAASKGWVDAGIISHRCTSRLGAFWAGKYSADELRWTAGESEAHAQYPVGTIGRNVYDEHYDIDEHALEVAARLLDTPVSPHVAGLDPEQIDWAAHKAFLGERRD
jgi:hypothetical protein